MSKKEAQERAARQANQSLRSVLEMFAVVVGCLLVYHVFLGSESVAVAEHSGASKGIVVVDSKAVLTSFMEVMEGRIAQGEEMSEGQLKMSGEEFAAEYMRAIKKYRDAGYLVIDKQYALGVPNRSEITAQIGEALSLEVTPTPDPFAAPVLE